MARRSEIEVGGDVQSNILDMVRDDCIVPELFRCLLPSALIEIRGEGAVRMWLHGRDPRIV